MIAQHIDVQTLCKRLSISRPTVERWLRNDDLAMPRPVKVGKKRLWPEAELMDWLSTHRHNTASH